jgi:voltage-gated potassium channel
MRLVTSVRRGIGALNRTLKRRGFGYVVLLSCILTLAFAAGMLQFESRDALQQAGYGPETSGFRNYTDALWWCAMMMTTMGSDHWPVTAGGRLLCWLLAVYAFTVFGYITAFLATWFLQADKGASR